MNCVTHGLFCLALLAVIPRSAADALSSASAREYGGTTPCGQQARAFLESDKATPCDKITWRLTLWSDGGRERYKLIATLGSQEPSGPGFVEGSRTVELEGMVNTITEGTSNTGRRIYRLASQKSDQSLSLVMVNDNLLHLLDRKGKPMVGNEFWSYTLNRKGVGRSR